MGLRPRSRVEKQKPKRQITTCGWGLSCGLAAGADLACSWRWRWAGGAHGWVTGLMRDMPGREGGLLCVGKLPYAAHGLLQAAEGVHAGRQGGEHWRGEEG